MPEALDMDGRVAIVAGAGPGIGRACALAFARDGADVVVAARRAEPLRALAAEVEAETGRRALAVPTDLAESDACRALVDASLEAFGRIDALVHVATLGGPRAAVMDMDWDGYLDSAHFNVAATMRLAGIAAAPMIEGGGGAIVQIGALSSTTLIEKLSRYTSTKAAMVAMAKTMAREVGKHGVRVNVVTPGFTEGEAMDAMFRDMAERSGRDAAELKARAAKEAALERHVSPDDIANACVFLASDRGRNITGVELHVNAGQWIG